MMHPWTQTNRRIAVALALLLMTAVPAGAQSPAPSPAPSIAKKAVTSTDDLPRFTYPVEGTASALLQADPATFNAFAAKVKADIDGVLAGYDIQDHATLRDLLNTEIAIDVLAGAPAATIVPIVARVRSLEDKPDAKLISGLRTESIVGAQAEAGSASGAPYLAAFQTQYAAKLAPLPWPVVGTSLKQTKSGFETLTPALIIGQAQGDLDPVVAKSHALSNDSATELINLRYALDVLVPLKAATLAVLTPLVAKNTVVKPDIWAARDVTITAAQHLAPVNVGIWDGGSDIALFPGRVFTDPTNKSNPHGFAFNLESVPTTGVLYPLTAKQKALYPQFIGYLEGFADLQSSIDSPAASAVKQKLTTLPASEVPTFFENLELYSGTYGHGTHVAGIAMRGNAAARIVVGRITYEYRTIPEAPTDKIVAQGALADYAATAYFHAHHVRVVNMSWGESPADYESALEKNGIGKDATARKALARKYFLSDRNALYDALKRTPDVLYVCSAGNSNADSGFDEAIPASFDLPNLLVVGAVDQAGDETSFTSYGKTVSVDADGYHVPSYFPGGSIVRLSGTSMASPNAANLAAKLIALDPKLTPVQVIALIQKGATTTPDGRRHLIDPKASVALLHRMMQEGRSK
jgi:subtilisin family serine protease